MVMRLLWEPLPQSWPKVAPERPGGLRGLLARMREMAAVVRHYDDLDRRMRREAVQVVVREAYQQTLAEQDSKRCGPAEFAEAWKARLAGLLAQETVKVSGRSKITVADLDVGLGWSLYEAVSRARSDAVTHAIATPSTPRGSDSQTLSYEFWITARSEHQLGRVQYEVCEPCGAGRLNKISFSAEWRSCGLGTLALRQLEIRHPGLTWYTTTQYARGFFDRYRLDSDSPWTEERPFCPHL